MKVFKDTFTEVLIYAGTAAKSQYFEVGEIFVNIQFELLFYNQNNHPWNVFNFCVNAHNFAKNHWKHVKLDKVLDNEGPIASVGNDTSILNTLKIVSCCPYSTLQHYYFDKLSNVYELTSQLRNVAELTNFSFLSH